MAQEVKNNIKNCTITFLNIQKSSWVMILFSLVFSYPHQEIRQKDTVSSTITFITWENEKIQIFWGLCKQYRKCWTAVHVPCMPYASRNFCWQILLWLRLFKTCYQSVWVCACLLDILLHFFSNWAYFPSGWQDTVHPRSLPHSLMSPAPQSCSCWTVLPQMLRWVIFFLGIL